MSFLSRFSIQKKKYIQGESFRFCDAFAARITSCGERILCFAERFYGPIYSKWLITKRRPRLREDLRFYASRQRWRVETSSSQRSRARDKRLPRELSSRIRFNGENRDRTGAALLHANTITERSFGEARFSPATHTLLSASPCPRLGMT